MQAIILVEDLGPHLNNVINDPPKSMAEIVNKPFLEYLVEKLKATGIQNIIFSLTYKDNIIESYFSDGSPWGINIQYSYEKEFIGTVSAIKNAKNMVNDEYVLIINANIYYNINYHKLFQFSIENDLDMTIIDEERNSNIAQCEKVPLDDSDIIFLNENTILDKFKLINGKGYLIKTELIDKIPIGNISFEINMILQWIKKHKRTVGIVNSQYSIDIRIQEDYHRFINDIRIRNANYKKQLLEYTEILLHEAITATCTQFVIWKALAMNYFRNIYGENSSNYHSFVDLKFEPDCVYVTENYRKTLENFLKRQIIYIKKELINSSSD